MIGRRVVLTVLLAGVLFGVGIGGAAGQLLYTAREAVDGFSLVLVLAMVAGVALVGRVLPDVERLERVYIPTDCAECGGVGLDLDTLQLCRGCDGSGEGRHVGSPRR